MRRLLTLATLFASLLPLSSAAVEVSTQGELKTAWEDTSASTITIASPIEIKGCSEAWSAVASSITLTGKTGTEQLHLSSSDMGQLAYAQMLASDVTIEKLSLKNDDAVYLLQATSVTLNNVTIASSSNQSAVAAVDTTELTLNGTLTLDLNSPCYKLLSRSDSLTCNTDFSGIIINIGNGFRLGDNGVTYLMEFRGTAPTLDQLKCTVSGGSGQRVTIRTEQGSAYLCLEVPEPGSATLTLIGLIALLHRRRRPCGRGIHGGAYVRG